jgi:HAD superfamily hydrolase (TIGR01509 family)
VPYSCVLFDLDDTLVDTQALVRKAWERCGGPSLPRAEQAYRAQYARLVRTEAKLLDPATPRVLAILAERGVRLGVVTSAPRCFAVPILGATGLLRLFDACLVTRETCGRQKPAPHPIRRALELLAHPPSRALYIGDAPDDALASRRCGIHFGLAGWARHGGHPGLSPDLILRSLGELPRWCRG